MIARASPWTAAEVAAVVDGELFGRADRPFCGVSTDTRDALRDHLFVALVGETHDAHRFLHDAVSAGAGGLLIGAGPNAPSPAEIESLARQLPVIRTADTLLALGALARANRRRHRARIYALTGSNGKTSTKEMAAAIAATRYRVLKTEGNLNNQIGLPMTLLGLREEHEVAVIEMGMNRTGEIAMLTQVAEPDAAVVINVGPAHIGLLGSIEAVASAKGELYRGLGQSRAVGVVNLDDPRVVAEADRAGLVHRRSFGRREGADVRLLSATPAGEAQMLELELDGAALRVELPFLGAHNALNATAAVALMTAEVPGAGRLSFGPEDIAEGLRSARKVAGRLNLEQVGPYWVVDDCYNANGDSMKAALATVAARARREGSRLVAVLGEMRELGAFSEQEHREVGEAVAASGAALLAAFGPDARFLAEAAEAAGVTVHHEPVEIGALVDWMRPRLRDGDVVLVKGSRGTRMERVIDLLRRSVG